MSEKIGRALITAGFAMLLVSFINLDWEPNIDHVTNPVLWAVLIPLSFLVTWNQK